MFAKLLEHKDLEVRLVAGENIAFLVELEREVQAAASPEDEFDAESLYPTIISMSDVLEKLEELSAERNRYQSKDKLMKQRIGFREFVASIQVCYCAN